MASVKIATPFASNPFVHNPYTTPLPKVCNAPRPYQPPTHAPVHQPVPTTRNNAPRNNAPRPQGGPRRNRREKQPVCLDYLKGVCHLKRWKCKYSHPPLSLINTERKHTERESNVCEVYLLTGFCKFGDKCRDYHPPLETLGHAPLCAPAKVKVEEEQKRSKLDVECSSTHSSDRGSDTAGSISTVNSNSGITPPQSPTGTGSTRPSLSGVTSVDQAIRKINGILNRLTPERFDSLLQQLFELLTGDQADACLQRVLPLVFARAIAEPKLCHLYARMTKHLYSLVGSDEQPVLRAQLHSLSSNLLFGIKDVLEAVCDDTEQLARLQTKRLGNIQFIGELVCQEILTMDRFYTVVDHLFSEAKSDDAEGNFNIELLCRLLTTAGADLSRRDRYGIERTVRKLHTIALDGHSMRVGMLSLNVMDLCFKHNWKAVAHN